MALLLQILVGGSREGGCKVVMQRAPPAYSLSYLVSVGKSLLVRSTVIKVPSSQVTVVLICKLCMSIGLLNIRLISYN